MEGQLRGNNLVCAEGMGNTPVSKLERNSNLATDIIFVYCFDGLGETSLSGSYMIRTIETHCGEAVSPSLTPLHASSRAVSLKSISLENQALRTVFLSSKSSKATVLS